MKMIKTISGLRQAIGRAKRAGKTIGFVPTMGAFHEGHLSLMRKARKESDLVVVSLFVNPTQFTQKSDYRHYPRTLPKDKKLAKQAGADLLFAPSALSLYPKDFQAGVEVSRLSNPWEGKHRPGHFRGVATVVTKLFNLVQPNRAYFGQKDFQQTRLIQQLVQDLNFPVRISTCPTVREPDGLAMSSRNQRLSPEDRQAAVLLFTALQAGKRLIEWPHRRGSGPLRRSTVEKTVRRQLQKNRRIRVEYAAVVDPVTLKRTLKITGAVRILVAARVGSVRLIDNCPAAPKRKGT